MTTHFDLAAALLPIALKHGASTDDVAAGIVDLAEVALVFPSCDWVERGRLQIILRSGQEADYRVSFPSMEDHRLLNGSGERRRAEKIATNALAAEMIFAMRNL